MKNVGGFDRAARVFLGASLVALGASKGKRWRAAFPAGLTLLYTAYRQYCPLSKAVGLDTYEEKNEPTIKATGKPLVQEASEESFPASDAPAWTTGTT
jgi:hypothetical protein